MLNYQRVYPPVINPIEFPKFSSMMFPFKAGFFQLATRGWHQRIDPMRSPNPIKSQEIPLRSHANPIKSPLNHHYILYCKSHEILNSATGENSVSRMRFSPSTRMFHGITTRTSVDFDSDDESVMLGQAMSRCLRYFTLKNTQVGQIHEYHNIYIYICIHTIWIAHIHIYTKIYTC